MPQPPTQLPFEIDDTVDPSLVTSRAGVPLAIELFRPLGVAGAGDAHGAGTQRQRGRRPSQLVESLIALWSAGGDRCPDLTTLREDAGLARLLGYARPAATTVRDFLDAVHADDLPLWAAGPKATVPQESAPLAGLSQANGTLLGALQHGAPETTAPLDVDATLVESQKAAATVASEGTLGYQPVVVRWAEQDVIVHDEFRDGRVPAGCGNVRILERAVAALPAGVTTIRVQGGPRAVRQRRPPLVRGRRDRGRDQRSTASRPGPGTSSGKTGRRAASGPRCRTWLSTEALSPASKPVPSDPDTSVQD